MNSVIFLFLLLLPNDTFSIQCQVCDSFQGYCAFDGTTCVGPKCSSRTAPTPSGLIREQRLCVPSDSPIGCRKTILWDEMEGIECVCDGHMCNSVNYRSLELCLITLVIFIFLF